MKKKFLSLLTSVALLSTIITTPVMAESYRMYATRLKESPYWYTYYYSKPDMSDYALRTTSEYVGTVTVSSMYRLYNANSGEHFYTASAAERENLKKVGWKYEGIAWYAPSKSNLPVYRLYNPNAGDHHYTTSLAEKNSLVKAGWNYEGIGWYSCDVGDPVYRQYNPNAKTGTHNYTTNSNEKDVLVQAGWRDEGVAFNEFNTIDQNLAERVDGNHTEPTPTPRPSDDNKNTPTPKPSNVNGYGTITGTFITYKTNIGEVPDTGSSILLVPKDKSAYDYDIYYYAQTISNADSQKYHIYSAKVNAVGTYTINHVAAGDYKMIAYSEYYDIGQMTRLGFSNEEMKNRKNTIYNEFAPYINSKSANNIAWIYNASNIHDVTIFPNETTSQDG